MAAKLILETTDFACILTLPCTGRTYFISLLLKILLFEKEKQTKVLILSKNFKLLEKLLNKCSKIMSNLVEKCILVKISGNS